MYNKMTVGRPVVVDSPNGAHCGIVESRDDDEIVLTNYSFKEGASGPVVAAMILGGESVNPTCKLPRHVITAPIYGHTTLPDPSKLP